MKVNNLDMKSQFDKEMINGLSVVLLRKMGINENKSYLNESDIDILVRQIQNSCYRIKQSRFEFRKSTRDFSQELVNVMDRDNDGKVSMEEFLDFFTQRLSPLSSSCVAVPALSKNLSSASLAAAREREFDVLVDSGYEKVMGGNVENSNFSKGNDPVFGISSKESTAISMNVRARSDEFKENCEPCEPGMRYRQRPVVPSVKNGGPTLLRRTNKLGVSNKSINFAETCDDFSSKNESKVDQEANSLQMKPFVSFSQSIRNQVSKNSLDIRGSTQLLKLDILKQIEVKKEEAAVSLNLQKKVTSESCFTKNIDENSPMKKVMSMHQVHEPEQAEPTQKVVTSEESEEEESEYEREDKSILRRTVKINLTQFVNSEDSESDAYSEGMRSEKSKLSKSSKFVSFKENPIKNHGSIMSLIETKKSKFNFNLNLSKIPDDIKEDKTNVSDFDKSIANERGSSSNSSVEGRKIEVNFSHANSVYSNDNLSGSTLSPQDSAKVPRLRHNWTNKPRTYVAWDKKKEDSRSRSLRRDTEPDGNYSSYNHALRQKNFQLKNANRDTLTSSRKGQLLVKYGKRDALRANIIERSGRSKSSNLKPVIEREISKAKYGKRKLNFDCVGKSEDSLAKQSLSKSTSYFGGGKYRNKETTSTDSLSLKYGGKRQYNCNLIDRYNGNAVPQRRTYEMGDESYRLKQY